jgi:hypothetical protein
MMRRESCIEETSFRINVCLIALAALEDLIIDVVKDMIGRRDEIVVACGGVRKVDHTNNDLATLLLLVLGD